MIKGFLSLAEFLGRHDIPLKQQPMSVLGILLSSLSRRAGLEVQKVRLSKKRNLTLYDDRICEYWRSEMSQEWLVADQARRSAILRELSGVDLDFRVSPAGETDEPVSDNSEQPLYAAY